MFFATINSLTLPTAFANGVDVLAQYLGNMMLPNGYDPQYGDSDYVNHRTDVAKAAENLTGFLQPISRLGQIEHYAPLWGHYAFLDLGPIPVGTADGGDA